MSVDYFPRKPPRAKPFLPSLRWYLSGLTSSLVQVQQFFGQQDVLGHGRRVSVLECGSPLALSYRQAGDAKRQRTAALQNIAGSSSRFAGRVEN